MDIDKPSVVLGKYDEEIEGLKKKSFKLGTCLFYFIIQNLCDTILSLILCVYHFLGVDQYQVKRETIKEKLKKNLNQDSLNSTQLKLASDYYNDSEMSVKFKKVKVFFLSNSNLFKVLKLYLYIFREKN